MILLINRRGSQQVLNQLILAGPLAVLFLFKKTASLFEVPLPCVRWIIAIVSYVH
jgi:hypothetical protein